VVLVGGFYLEMSFDEGAPNCFWLDGLNMAVSEATFIMITNLKMETGSLFSEIEQQKEIMCPH
jgi:hypothetical protein